MQINSTPPIGLDPLIAPATTRTSTAVPEATDSSAAPAQGPQAASIPASYTTNAGGKSYSASVEEAGGVYVASVEVPPEASATGSSVQAAEDSLSARIDALV
jgi:hypothetical protein